MKPLVKDFETPNRAVNGSATQAAKEPLIAKTIKIRKIWILDVIPQRAFNFSI